MLNNVCKFVCGLYAWKIKLVKIDEIINNGSKLGKFLNVLFLFMSFFSSDLYIG